MPVSKPEINKIYSVILVSTDKPKNTKEEELIASFLNADAAIQEQYRQEYLHGYETDYTKIHFEVRTFHQI